MAAPFNEVSQLINEQQSKQYSVYLADSDPQRRQCYKLRYDVFANEKKVNVYGNEPGLDRDRFDQACRHLAVYDNRSHELIATTRLLNNQGRNQIGVFYAETEFNLDNILSDDCRFLEIGRTCIHPNYRQGAALSMLWHGIAHLVAEEDIDYVIACVSVPLLAGDKYLTALMYHLRDKHFSPESLRVRPLIPLRTETQAAMPDDVIPSPLLKSYLRQGALICGEPYWDAATGVADLFVILDANQVANHHALHAVEEI